MPRSKSPARRASYSHRARSRSPVRHRRSRTPSRRAKSPGARLRRSPRRPTLARRTSKSPVRRRSRYSRSPAGRRSRDVDDSARRRQDIRARLSLERCVFFVGELRADKPDIHEGNLIACVQTFQAEFLRGSTQTQAILQLLDFQPWN